MSRLKKELGGQAVRPAEAGARGETGGLRSTPKWLLAIGNKNDRVDTRKLARVNPQGSD